MSDRAQMRHDLYALNSEGAGSVLRGVCTVELNAIKDKLIDSEGTHTLILQGEARAWRQLLKYLTSPPLPQPNRFDNSIPSNL